MAHVARDLGLAKEAVRGRRVPVIVCADRGSDPGVVELTHPDIPLIQHSDDAREERIRIEHTLDVLVRMRGHDVIGRLRSCRGRMSAMRSHAVCSALERLDPIVGVQPCLVPSEGPRSSGHARPVMNDDSLGLEGAYGCFRRVVVEYADEKVQCEHPLEARARGEVEAHAVKDTNTLMIQTHDELALKHAIQRLPRLGLQKAHFDKDLLRCSHVFKDHRECRDHVMAVLECTRWVCLPAEVLFRSRWAGCGRLGRGLWSPTPERGPERADVCEYGMQISP
mmetsp:Transcript_9400/g.27394  ORF Transcript_9400/g.27394 Transcript_9400/m.27394 type:complete len:280 (-) Transcript_9400:81-920(-)